MPKNEADLKWTCQKCTYGNWPSARKCIMCKFSPNTSCRTSPVPDIGEPYDRLDDRICPPGSGGGGEEIITNNNEKNSNGEKHLKWTCPACSYSNWIKSEICIMCRLIKPNELRSVVSLRNLENSSEASQKDRSKFISVKGHKWTCPKCTYENWPRSQKCVICQTNNSKHKNAGKTEQSKSNNEKNVGTQVKVKKTSSPRRSPPRSPNALSRSSSANIMELTNTDDDTIRELAAAVEKLNTSGDSQRLNQIRNKMTRKDLFWLAACRGVVDHDLGAVKNYVSGGGEKTRSLTADDILILDESGKLGRWEAGDTLVHLAIKYQHQDVLRLLLIPDTPHRASKKLPCHVCPELAASVRKQLAHSIRSPKTDFLCPFFTDVVTFSLPGEICDLDPQIRNQLFLEILDRDVRKVLEEELLINWSEELMNQYGSCLYPLWNRAAGDCLLDSVLQATWGVFDRENVLRRKLFDALSEGYQRFFPRWQEAEQMQASEMNYTLEEEQWKSDWSNIVGLAATAGTSLEQAHVFALAHILRRPIIIYAVKYVKSLHGEMIDLARFEGVYLPLLWDEGFCWKNPITLGYTRGHFSALVPMERPSYANYAGAGAPVEWNEDDAHVTYLPLIDHEGHLLPIHFLTVDEIGQEEQLLQKRLDCCFTDGGILSAKQIITPRPVLAGQLVDEWLNRYRKAQIELMESKASGAFKP